MRLAAPLVFELSRRLCGDGAAVPKARDVEVERRNPGEASQTLRQVLVPQAETKIQQVAGGVGNKQDAADRPQKRKLPGAVPWYMECQ
jgi:hypothetical protein